MSDLKKALLEIPELLKAVKTQFSKIHKEKFLTVKTKDGKTLECEGDTHKPGMAINIVDGEKKDPAPTGEYSFEDGSVIVVENGKIVDVKPAKKEEKPPEEESEFMKYLKSDSYSDDKKYKFEEYPWDKCIADQEKDGVDCPECVCAAIKNRTVKQLIEKKFAKDEKEAIGKIAETFKGNPVIAYLFTRLLTQEPVKATDQTKEIDDLKKSFSELKDTFASMLKIVDKLAALPSEFSTQKKKNGTAVSATDEFQQEIIDFRKQNNL